MNTTSPVRSTPLVNDARETTALQNVSKTMSNNIVLMLDHLRKYVSKRKSINLKNLLCHASMILTYRVLYWRIDRQ